MNIGFGRSRLIGYAIMGALIGAAIFVIHDLLEIFYPESHNWILVVLIPLIAAGMALIARSENAVYEWGSRLEAARKRINELMLSAVAERHWVQSTHDPFLVTCWRKLECDKEDCPVYGREHARCWLIAGTYCRGEVQGQFARKIHDCQLCPVYRNATEDPVREISENFMAMNYLLSEREEQLESAYNEARDRSQKLAGLVTLSEAALSSVHLSEVMQNLLESAAQVVGADMGFVSLADSAGDALGTAATYGLAPGSAAELTVKVGEGIVGRAFAGTYIAISEDLTVDSRFVAPFLKNANVRTLISLPLVGKQQPLGMLTLGTFSPHHYSDEERDSLCVAADRIAAAIENVKLNTELSRDRGQIELMEVVTRDLVSQDHVGGIYDSFIQHAVAILDFDGASLFRWHPEAGEIEILAVSTKAPKTWLAKGLRLPLGAAAVGDVIESGVSLVRDEITGDEYQIDKLLVEEGVKSYVILPLRVKGAVLGAVMLNSFRAHAFSTDDLELLEPLARQLGLVLDNARLLEEAKRLSLVDSTTGLYNHRYFYDVASREMSRSARHGRPVAVMLIGIDGFQEFTRSRGRVQADRLLQDIAGSLKANVRGADVVARYGGDEFAVLLPYLGAESAGSIDLASVAGRIRRAITGVLKRDDSQPPVGLSIGAAGYPDHASDTAGLLERADWALREARAGHEDFVLAEKPY